MKRLIPAFLFVTACTLCGQIKDKVYRYMPLKEDLSVIEGKIGAMLSDLEKDVLVKYMEGKSYQEISDEMGRHVKSIDNALQRVKRKLQKYLDAK